MNSLNELIQMAGPNAEYAPGCGFPWGEDEGGLLGDLPQTLADCWPNVDMEQVLDGITRQGLTLVDAGGNLVLEIV